MIIFVYLLCIFFTEIDLFISNDRIINNRSDNNILPYSYDNYVTCCTQNKRVVYSIITYSLLSLGVIFIIIDIFYKDRYNLYTGIFFILLSICFHGAISGFYNYFKNNNLLKTDI